jgi:hypothetical protein
VLNSGLFCQVTTQAIEKCPNSPDNCAIHSIVIRIPDIPCQLGLLQVAVLLGIAIYLRRNNAVVWPGFCPSPELIGDRMCNRNIIKVHFARRVVGPAAHLKIDIGCVKAWFIIQKLKNFFVVLKYSQAMLFQK